MKFVALVSGGKDSCYNALQCVRNGHELVCLANLYPPAATSDEADSFMYQSAAHTAIEAQAECFGKPLIRRELSGKAVNQSLQYVPTEEDEVEDLLLLLKEVQERFPEVRGVASGAILSNYQRTRVENVCGRLGLQSLTFLWRKRQSPLLEEMVEAGIDAVLVKVASFGLEPSKHLGKSIGALRPFFEKLHGRCGFHVCGEGGEYETLTLDCPLFVRRLVLDETVVVNHSDDMFAPVGLLKVVKCHTETKNLGVEETETAQSHAPAATVAGGNAAPIVGKAGMEAERGVQRCTRKNKAQTMVPNFLPHVHEASGGLLYLSGVRIPAFIPSAEAAAAAAAEQVKACLSAARASLEGAGVSTMKDVCFVHLYLRDMGHFASVNAEYCTWFEGENPPSRSCVSVALPAGCLVMLDLVAVRGSGQALAREGAACAQRQVLHVRSLSNWAPVCIGPYCQANTIGPGNAIALIAGQIGLIPASMVLPPRPTCGGTAKSSVHEEELALCVRHASAVASAVGSSLSRGCMFATLYMSQEAAVAAATASHTAGGNWMATLVEECRELIAQRFAEERAEAIAAEAGTGQRGEQRGEDDGDDSAEEDWTSDPEELAKEAARKRVVVREIPILPVVVPTLPKNSAVELEVLCMSRTALSLLPCKPYNHRHPAAAPADQQPVVLLRHTPLTTSAGGAVPIPPHLLPRRPCHTTPTGHQTNMHGGVTVGGDAAVAKGDGSAVEGLAQNPSEIAKAETGAEGCADYPGGPKGGPGVGEGMTQSPSSSDRDDTGGDGEGSPRRRSTHCLFGRVNVSVSTSGSTVDRVLCVVQSSLVLKPASAGTVVESTDPGGISPGIAGDSAGLVQSRETEKRAGERLIHVVDGTDTGSGAHSSGRISLPTPVADLSAAQLEQALRMLLDKVSKAISAARLRWNDVSSLRVYFSQPDQPLFHTPPEVGPDNGGVDGLSAAADREGSKASGNPEGSIERAFLLALAGQTRARPAVSLVPVSDMGGGTLVCVHATAWSLERLKTELWVRGAS